MGKIQDTLAKTRQATGVGGGGVGGGLGGERQRGGGELVQLPKAMQECANTTHFLTRPLQTKIRLFLSISAPLWEAATLSLTTTKPNDIQHSSTLLAYQSKHGTHHNGAGY
jgi:hypothetical protein